MAKLTPMLIEPFGTVMRSFAFGTAMDAGVRAALTLLALVFFVTAMTHGGGTITGPHCDPMVTFAGMLCTSLDAAHYTFDVMKALVYTPAQVLGAALVTIEGWGALPSSAPPPA